MTETPPGSAEGLPGNGHPFNLTWRGPFLFTGDKDRLVFNTAIGKDHGVYLLTVEHNGGFLVYSCGITRRPFKKRFAEHLRCYRAGIYSIFDAKQFTEGVRKKVWRGFWFKKRRPEYELDFRERSEQIALATKELLATFRIFLAPVEADTRELERMEAAIMDLLYRNPSTKIAEFPDIGMALRPRSREDEESFTVENKMDVLLHGIPQEFEA